MQTANPENTVRLTQQGTDHGWIANGDQRMASVILTPLIAETSIVATGALFVIGIAIGAVVMYLVGLSARSQYQSASQQLANLQGQNLKKRPATVGIPQGEAPNVSLPPVKTGLPPKKDKPQSDSSSSELTKKIESLTAQNSALSHQVELEQQQRASELQRIAELEQALAGQPSDSPDVGNVSSDQQWQLAQLHRENVSLQSKVDQYRDQIAALKSRSDSSPESHNAETEAETARLQQQVQQLDEVQTQADRLAERLYASEEQLRDTQLQVEQSEQANAHLQVQISEYHATVAKLEEQIAAAAETDSGNASLDEMRSILAQSEAAVASLEREKIDYKAQLEDLQRRLTDEALLAETTEATVEENAANKELIAKLKDELAQRDEQLLAVQKSVNDLYTARDRVVTLEIANAERNATVERLEAELHQARSAAKESTESITDPEELAALKSDLELKTTQLADSMATIAELQRQLADAEAAQPPSASIDPEALEALQAELAAKTEQLAETAESVSNLQRELEDAKRAIEEQQSEETAVKPEEVVALKADLESKEDEIATVNATMAALEETLSAAQSKLESAEARIADDQQQIEHLKREMADLVSQEPSIDELESSRAEIARLTAERDAERTKVPPHVSQELELLQAEVARREEEKTASALRFAELTQTITQLTNDLEQERTNTPPPVAHKMGALQHEIEQRTAFADQTTNELNELRAALHQVQSEKGDVEAERDSARAEIRKLQKKSSQLDDLNKDLANAQEERAALQDKEKELSTRVVELESKLRDATHERDTAARLASNLKEQVDGSPTAQAEIVAMQQQIMTLISDKEKERDLREEAQYRAEDLEAELAEIKQAAPITENGNPTAVQLNDAKLEIEQLKTTCLKYQAEAEQHAHDLVQKTSQLAEFDATAEIFESVKQELKGQVAFLTERTQSLEHELAGRNEKSQPTSGQEEHSRILEARITELERQLDDSNTRRAQLQTANEEAQQQIEDLRASGDVSSSFSEAEATIAALQKRLQTERASLEQGIQQRDRQIQFLTNDRDEIKKNAELAIEQSKQQLDPLKDKTEELVATIAQARTEQQSMSGKLAAEQRANSHLKERLVELEAKLEAQVAANQQLAERLTNDSNARIAEAEGDAQATREKLQHAIGKIRELEAACQEQSKQSSDAPVEGESPTAERMKQLETQIAEFEEENTLLTAEMRQLRDQTEAFEKRMLETQAENERLIAAAKDVDDLPADSKADTKKGKLKKQIKELEAELSSTKEELFNQSESANVWRKERSSLLNEIEALSQQLESRKKGETDGQVEGEDITEEYSQFVERHDQLVKELERSERDRDEKEERLDQLASALAEARRDIASLNSELSESKAVIRSQNRKLQSGATHTESGATPSEASAKSKPKRTADSVAPKKNKKSKSTKKKIKAKPASKKQKANRKRSQSSTVHDPDIGEVFRTPPEHRDDLRAIKGLGPKFQEKLNEIGIYQYSQVAAWNAKTCAEMANRIGAGPRIQNDKWVQQAKQLAKKSTKR